MAQYSPKDDRPGAYSSFTIHAPKRRLISAAPFRDHALCNAIEPVFERSFVYDSYANRIGKGTHRALDRARVYARRHRYVLQCDVRQFFPSIDHAILARKVDDPDVLWLVDRILWPNLPESRHDPWLTTRDENGTPGAVIAPLRLFSEQLAVCRRTSVAAACKSCFDLLRCETQVRSYKPRLQSVTPTDCQDASGSQAD